MLEDLAALNREISALVRSGLPLEEGLRQVATDFSGPTSRLAARLAADTDAGMSLGEAVAAQGDSLPPVYRAVVEAGLRSGRLSTALEGFAETADRMAALRRIAGQAAVYPLIVVIVAWLMLLFAVAVVLPGYDALEMQQQIWITPLRLSGNMLGLLAVIVPIALFALATIWWRASGESAAAPRHGRWLQWVPGGRRGAMLSGQANFADLLHMLLSCRVPLPEALPLAAMASGAFSLESPAKELAAEIAAGRALASQTGAIRQLPPLVRTAFLANGTEGALLAGLERAAQTYRERAAAWVIDVAVTLPVAITLLLGIGVVGLYGVLMLQPYVSTLHELANWKWQ
jgi:general secretion pathway protein F